MYRYAGPPDRSVLDERKSVFSAKKKLADIIVAAMRENPEEYAEHIAEMNELCGGDWDGTYDLGDGHFYKPKI